MEAGKFLKLYDSCWFELEIFKKQPAPSISETKLDLPNQEKPPNLEIFRIPTFHNRSMSDQLNSNTSFMSESSLSPEYPSTPKLHTILSGKEVADFVENPEQNQIKENLPNKKLTNERRNRRRRKGGESKSLTDLEFEELKGFMDLGFVFSEEDRESSLASIIPGLQRLGKRDDEEEDDDRTAVIDESTISRPYLSEAWEVFDMRKKESYNPILMNWRVPALSNEMDMKDNLRWWAQTVASTVR
ncbi:hypothetical protein UlMin_018656 [Ulmus minor]